MQKYSNKKVGATAQCHGNDGEIVTEFEEILVQAAHGIGMELSEGEIASFHTYYREILFWNKKISLVSAKSPTDLPVKHCIDSLTAMKVIGHDCLTLLDIGAGAGFPGIPIKIMRPSLKVTLVDAHRKKVSFLKNVARKLDLSDTIVLNQRIEGLMQDEQHRGMYDCVISRATFALSKYLDMAAPFLTAHGVLIAMKGRGIDAELDGNDDITRRAGIMLAERHEISLPVIGDKRIILTFKRTD